MWMISPSSAARRLSSAESESLDGAHSNVVGISPRQRFGTAFELLGRKLLRPGGFRLTCNTSLHQAGQNL